MTRPFFCNLKPGPKISYSWHSSTVLAINESLPFLNPKSNQRKLLSNRNKELTIIGDGDASERLVGGNGMNPGA